MNINKLFPSKFIKADDLNGHDYTLTIQRMVVETVGAPPKQEEKPVLYFDKASKGLILNRTNAMTIAALYSPETDNWIGKRITLYATKVRAFGAMHDAVRIREQVPPPPKNGQAPPPLDDVEDVADEPDLDYDDEAPPATNGNGHKAAEPIDDPFVDAEPVNPDPMSPKTRKTFHALGTEVYGDEWDAKRHELVQAVSKGAITSSNDLTEKEAETLMTGMRKLRAQRQAKAAQAA